jgi:hypothetical protein
MTNTDTATEQLPEWWTTAELADYFALSPRTLRRWRAIGFGPAWERDGRRVRYHRDAIATYLASVTVPAITDDQREHTPT